MQKAEGRIKTPNSELRTLNSKGFTLIEVILVMAIIGILAAFLMPRIDFRLPGAASVGGAAEMVASDIRYAQECAMANRVQKQINFTKDSSTYTFGPAGPSSSLDPSGQLPPGVTITSPTYTLTFNSLGEPISIVYPDLYVDVVVARGGLPSKTIRILNFTGKVSFP
jgi:prepilin-type N-terminal cleavage/methylation domain-containing protein